MHICCLLTEQNVTTGKNKLITDTMYFSYDCLTLPAAHIYCSFLRFTAITFVAKIEFEQNGLEKCSWYFETLAKANVRRNETGLKCFKN